MDFDHIHTLLDVFLKSINIPHTEKIRAAIVEELKAINDPIVDAPEPIVEDKDLFFGARKL